MRGVRLRLKSSESSVTAGAPPPDTGTLDIGPDFGDGQNSVTFTVGTVSLSATTSNVLASKDSWAPTVAGCVDDTNKDGTDLQVEGVVATEKRILIGWDLSSYPTGTTVSSATITFYVKVTSLVDNGRLATIPTANESWTEAGLICSNFPAIEDNVHNAVFPLGTTGDQSVSYNLTGRSRIANRMGVSSFSTIIYRDNVLLTNVQLQSKDSGGSPGNASGPRLTWSWNKTL